jgi:hypothetical protein
MTRWASLELYTPATESATELVGEDERHTLWRDLLDALCNWAAPPLPTRRDADAMIAQAERLGDRWRSLGLTHDHALEQTRLMHVVLHDAFRTWTYDDRWLATFESGYTVATLAIVLGLAKEHLERTGRWVEVCASRHQDWRRFLRV